MPLLEQMLKRKLKTVKTDKFIIDMNLPKEYPPIAARKTEEGGVRDRFMVAKAELPDEITVVRPFDVDGFEKSNANTFYIAQDGCDCNCGCKDKPLATLAEALKRVEGKGGAKIVFRGGTYTHNTMAVINDAHSGTVESPLIITAEKGETVYISGGNLLPSDSFVKVEDERIYNRLHPAARDNILVCDLKALGVEEYGVFGSGTMFVVNGDRYTVARYPNEGDARERIPMENRIINHGKKEVNRETGEIISAEPWVLGESDERCYGWEWNDDLWVYGSFFYEWTHLNMKLGGIDKENKTISGDVNDRSFHSINYQEEFSHYYVNVLEELDIPGEWYLDRAEGKLYVYPKNGSFAKTDDIRLIVSKPMMRRDFKPGMRPANDMILVDGAKNVIINGLDMGRTNGAPIRVTNCQQVLVQNCRFTSYVRAISVSEGFRNGIIGCRMEYFSQTAASVGGGDRLNFIPSNNFIQNCIVFNSKVPFGMNSGGGVGNVVSHNYLYNTRFGDGGNNECIMEYNIVEGGDTETSDSGMIYVAGGGCSSCANHYRYNFFFDFAKLDYGVYFDDMSRGMYAYGNVVIGNGVNPGHEDICGKWWPSGGRSFNHHNGGEHVFYNNISVDAGYFAFGGDVSYWLRSFDFWKGWVAGMIDAAKDKRTDKYMGRNPTYKDFVDALDQWSEDIKDPNYTEKSGWAERRLRSPWCNHYENNLIVRADKPYKLDHGIDTATGLETNYITNEDPGFVDEKNKNYALKPDSIVFEKIPGFVAPPFEKMGPVDDFAE